MSDLTDEGTEDLPAVIKLVWKKNGLAKSQYLEHSMSDLTDEATEDLPAVIKLLKDSRGTKMQVS